MKILVAINREHHTNADTICGVFEDSDAGLANAISAACALSDEPLVYRLELGVPLNASEFGEFVWG